MDAFDYAFQQTLGLEGGFSDDPDDKGGRTNYGITEAVFRDALNRMVISGVSDIKDLTTAQAKAIYKTDYWLKIRLNDVRDISIAAEIFDTAVNMGTTMAIKIAQRALNFLGERLEVDGVPGPKTIDALNRWSAKDARALFVCLNGYQFIRYVEIVTNNASQMKFSRGWTKRVQSYQKVA